MVIKVSGYSKAKGLAIMMEHPLPGQGGRHRQTLSYGHPPDASLAPRIALAKEVLDARMIYKSHGLYTPWIRTNLQLLIKLNQSVWIGSFDK
jgi:hypothetical protein